MTNSLFKESPSGSTAPERQQSGGQTTTVVTGPRSGTPEAGETAIEQARAIDKAAVIKREMVTETQQKAIDRLAGISSLDWKNIPPPMLAQMLIQIPFKGSGDEPDYYLLPFQAMIFAMRCFELGLSPFSNEVWFNPKNNKVNVTFEGKLKLARMHGLNLSPPQFERIPVDQGKQLIAYKCTIVAPTGKSEYTAYLKDWQVLKSPVWKSKPEHMLQLRAAEKCLSFATGSGASELPDERDLEVGSEVKAVLPEIQVEGGVR